MIDYTGKGAAMLALVPGECQQRADKNPATPGCRTDGALAQTFQGRKKKSAHDRGMRALMEMVSCPCLALPHPSLSPRRLPVEAGLLPAAVEIALHGGLDEEKARRNP